METKKLLVPADTVLFHFNKIKIPTEMTDQLKVKFNLEK